MSIFTVERSIIEESAYISPDRDIDKVEADFGTKREENFKTEKETDENSDLNLNEPITSRLSQERGGLPNEWEKDTSYQGDEEWRFNGTEIVDASGDSLTKKIEAMGNPKYIEQHREFLRHLRENPDKEYFQEDWIQETPEGRVLTVTVAKMDANGIIRNENWRNIDVSEKEEGEEEPGILQEAFDLDPDTSEIDYINSGEEEQSKLIATGATQEALTAAIEELFAEGEIEAEAPEAARAIDAAVSIAERMEQVALFFSEPQREEVSLDVPKAEEITKTIDISEDAPLLEGISLKIETEAPLEIKSETTDITERIETNLLGIAPEIQEAVRGTTEIPNEENAEVNTGIQIPSKQVAEPKAIKLVNEFSVATTEAVTPQVNPDTGPTTLSLEKPVIDSSSDQDSDQIKIENFTEVVPEVFADVKIPEVSLEALSQSEPEEITPELAQIETPSETFVSAEVTQKPEVLLGDPFEVAQVELPKLETTEIRAEPILGSAEETKEPATQILAQIPKTSEVVLVKNETVTKETEPKGIMLVRIDSTKQNREQVHIVELQRDAEKESQKIIKESNVETKEVVQEKVAQHMATAQSPEQFSRRQYLSQMFSVTDSAPANDNRVRVVARDGITMRLAA